MGTDKDLAASMMLAALKEIALGRGPFKRDPLEHAASVIEAMQETAQSAIDYAMAAGIIPTEQED